MVGQRVLGREGQVGVATKWTGWSGRESDGVGEEGLVAHDEREGPSAALDGRPGPGRQSDATRRPAPAWDGGVE